MEIVFEKEGYFCIWEEEAYFITPAGFGRTTIEHLFDSPTPNYDYWMGSQDYEVISFSVGEKYCGVIIWEYQNSIYIASVHDKKTLELAFKMSKGRLESDHPLRGKAND